MKCCSSFLLLLVCSPALAGNWTEGADSQDAYAYAQNELMSSNGVPIDADDDSSSTEPAQASPDKAYFDITTNAESDMETSCGAGRVISSSDYFYSEVDLQGTFVGGTLRQSISSADGEVAGDGNAIQDVTASGAGDATGRMFFSVDVDSNVEMTQDYTLTQTVGPSTVYWDYDASANTWSASGTYYKNGQARSAAIDFGYRTGPDLTSTVSLDWETGDDDFEEIVSDVSTARAKFSETGTIVSRAVRIIVRGEIDWDIE